LPRLLFVIMIMSMLGRGLLNIFIAIGLTGWVRVARLTRAQMLSLKEREFCEAARAAGASTLAIIVRHLLPNALTPIIISLTFGIPEAIFTEAALSFIGVGISPLTSSWGQMVGENQQYIGCGLCPVLGHLSACFMACSGWHQTRQRPGLPLGEHE